MSDTRLLACALAAAALVAAGNAAGHGALSGDADTCKLAIGPWFMHFIGYQPRASGTEEFCEDIPNTGPTIIVLESLDDALRDMEVGVTVVTGDSGKGEAVFTQPLRANSRGSITLMHTFPEAGVFTGVVTARRGDDTYRAEFPFGVGVPLGGTPDAASLPPLGWLVTAAVMLAIAGLWLSRRRGRRAAR